MSDQIIAIAMRLMTHFEQRGFNMEILNIFHPKVNEDLGGDFPEAFIEVLIARQRFQTIIDGKAFFYLTVLESIIGIPDFKLRFMKLPKMPFMPATLEKVKGSMIDRQSPLGIFFRLSVLGFTPSFYHQESEALNRMDEKVRNELGKDKYVKDRRKYYEDLQQ